MATSLTGDFDAVVQVSVPTVNRVLATLHQNGGAPTGAPTFPHSLVASIGAAAPKPGKPKIGGGGEPTSADAALAHHGGGLPPLPISIARGVAEVQFSPPTITLPPGSASDVTVHSHVMAHYTADADTLALPAFIDGEIEATVAVEHVPWKGESILQVNIGADDVRPIFTPAAGTSLTADEQELVTQQMSQFLRRKFEPVNARLPTGLDSLRFKKMVGAGGARAIALLVALSKASATKRSPDSVTEIFLKPGEDFAIGVAKEYLLSGFTSLLTALKAIRSTFKIKFLITWATYTVSVSDARVDFRPGEIVLTVTGSATTDSIFKNYYFTVTQVLHLVLDTATQVITLTPAGDPTITGLSGYEDRVIPDIIKQRDTALVSVRKAIQHVLIASTPFDAVLKSLGVAGHVRYTSVEVEPRGVVLRGTLTVDPRPPAHVQFFLTADRQGLSALPSWIPGGTIRRYDWSWSRSLPKFPFVENIERSDEHRFIMAIPEGTPKVASQWCLSVAGTQIPAAGSGGAEPTGGGSSCYVGSPVMRPVLTKPLDKYPIPVWKPDPSGPVTDPTPWIVAHFDAGGGSAPAIDNYANTLIHFGDPASLGRLPLVRDALRASTKSGAALSVILVLPRGSLDRMGPSVVEMLGELSQDPALAVAVTEDYEASWRDAVGGGESEATYLVPPRGQVAWRGTGQLDAALMKAAFDEHLQPNSRHTWQLLRLRVATGDPAPDFLFEYAQGERMALRKLRGQRVLLLFWTSWSLPCLAELRHLQQMYGGDRQQELIVLAINDGEDPQRAADTFRTIGLTLYLVPDPERHIARRYGVCCWPTSVSIDEEGSVSGSHVGISVQVAPPSGQTVTRAM